MFGLSASTRGEHVHVEENNGHVKRERLRRSIIPQRATRVSPARVGSRAYDIEQTFAPANGETAHRDRFRARDNRARARCHQRRLH